ncbi:hypothetical protein BD410DRAFT_903053 [Rickenella mellea]|uniref:Uncharacterized protein n=1 Tax=Rickenella mellea TaxID=50990 RepID=A0A4Y7PG41_9AGAM|nr:hypothetical protein BD410DRAFT_903053 [Rickenella mellea]
MKLLRFFPRRKAFRRQHLTNEIGGDRQNNFFQHLHEDLLIIIFTLLQSSVTPWYLRERKWIKATHVCRRWRQISLASPTLWTYVDTSWGTMATEFIARSGDAPLKLTIRLAEREPMALGEIMAINLAFAHVPRARELHIHVGRHGVEQLQNISSSLKVLKLHYRCTPLEVISFHSWSEAQFPHHFFLEFHPEIKRLKTCGALPPSNFEMFRQLTHLDMDFRGLPPVDILVMLEHCSRLVDVEFSIFHWMHEPHEHRRGPFITLPFLRQICFQNCPSTCIHLLDHLILPPTVSLIVGDSPISTSLFPPISSSLFSPPFDNCLLNFWDSSMGISCLVRANDTQRSIDVNLNSPSDEDLSGPDLKTFRTGFEALLPHLQNLTIALSLTHTLRYSTSSWSVAEIASVLVSVPNLCTLTINDYFFAPNCNKLAENFLDALHVQQSGASPEPAASLVCPSLRTFTLINFDFPLSPSDDKCLQKSFLDCASYRSNFGAKLTKVDVSLCRNVSTIFVDELAPLVDNVVQPVMELPAPRRVNYGPNLLSCRWGGYVHVAFWVHEMTMAYRDD